MPPHGPFLMPDGSSLAQALRGPSSEAGDYKRRTKSTTKRGKDLQFAMVAQQHHKLALAAASGGASASELAELRALEAVGARRRRRWVNDRTLREMAGPMTAGDMKSLFQPVPFGFRSQSALEVIAKPSNQYLWDGFRSIDQDKEARVLQRWEAAVRPQPAQCSNSDTPAGVALKRWSGLSKKSRCALRKANVHSVMALEHQILDFLDTAGPEDALVLPGLDSWGRLLVHSLASFHNLAAGSSTSARAAGMVTAIAAPPHTILTAIDEDDSGPSKTIADEPALMLWRRQQSGEVEAATVTATDVVMALAECGGGSLSVSGLQAFLRKHVHGSEASSVASEAGEVPSEDPDSSWVVV